ncbi:addiction module antidote protein [Pseudomonas agarici]|uniref:Antitoxin ParD n=1 Tax=Pseudomonas agarici TaxID=46677 RepID=A0A0X1T1Q0_PSEAA|nr:type II toxin-antitoxin system ParD family antitoxin [Pseudomonas agarici]AMB86000.1 addiction module antidote protein [Pseudomonas agarici]
MTTRNVVLTDHLEQVVNNQVRSGRYQNTSEALRERLRLLEQREAKALRHATSIGLMDLEQGRFVEVDGEGLSKLLADISESVAYTVAEKH